MNKLFKKIISSILIASFVATVFLNTQPVNAGGIDDIATQCFGIGAAAAKIKEAAKKELLDKAKNLAKDAAEKEIAEFLKSAVLGSITSVPVFDKQTAEGVMRAANKIRETQEDKSNEIQGVLAENHAEDCLTAITNFALKIALARLKKELLDRIADQTIEWINNDFKGEPRFITNFGDVFEDSYQSAIGGVARDIGLGKLCDEKLSLKLQLNLSSPVQKRFTQETQCTLDKIVGNINDFSKDFRNGGWVGYQETLSPNNNRFGLEILALDETYKAIDANNQEAAQESLTGSGFKGEKVCDLWTLNLIGNDGKVVPEEITLRFDKNFPDPQKSTGYDAGLTAIAKQDSGNLSLLNSYLPYYGGWKCTHTYTNTPGDTARTALQSTFDQDQNYIANAESLEDYVNVVFDAAINRLINKGVEGIVNAGKDLLSGDGMKSNSGTGRSNPPYSDPAGLGIKDRYNNSKNTSSTLGQTGETIGNQTITNQQNQQILDIQSRYNDAITQFAIASSSLASAKSSLDQIGDKLTNLSNCEKVKTSLREICFSTKRNQTTMNSYQAAINSATLLVTTTTKLFSQIKKPITLISSTDIPFTSSTLATIEMHISTIVQSAYNAKLFSTTKNVEVNTLLNICLNTSVYTCPTSIEE